MDAPKMQVKCSVTNCAYNKKKLCFADSLEVNAMGDGFADSSEGTCCSTFINE
ncbi:MAG: DUF1540 domain-containing protein [Syntrophomonadaceae bacterium]|nr:DUF1540 domain-containing protein [Syntrophomonadaceae bacterium]